MWHRSFGILSLGFEFVGGAGDERSLGAFTKVERAVSQVGSWRTLVFDDSRIHACIEDMGGWMRFCTATYDELPFLRNEFTKRYRAYLQHPPLRYPAVIKGEGGFDQQPVLIGNQELAKRVMLSGSTSSGLLEEFSNKIKKIAK
jgi:hypothetical protein